MEKTPRGCLWELRVLLLIMLSIVGCLMMGTAAADYTCHREANLWIPYYPDARVVQEDYSVFRPFGLGTTDVTLHSTDSRTLVVRWYVQLHRRVWKDRGTELASLDWYIEDDKAGGSNIYLSSVCGR